MGPKLLLGAASLLVKNRKAQLLFIGLQFVYIAYKVLETKKPKKKLKNKTNAISK